MINYIDAMIEEIVAHFIGSYSQGEDITYSNSSLNIEDPELQSLMFKYLLSHFKEPEFYNFTFTSDDLALNPVFNFVSNIFDDPQCLFEQSVKISRHLYEKSKHPNIKSGELYISYIRNILVEDELLDGIAIIKSENKDLFLKLDIANPEFVLTKDIGTNIGKLDKACLILNTEREKGYKICNIDHSNRNKEALYWREEFLFLKPRSDDYHQTKHYIQATKNFIKDRLTKEFDIDKTDEAGILNRSFEYFKNEDKFDGTEY